MKPLFVTFEGLDGSGKSTQLQLASAWMTERDRPHRVTQEPGGTPLGESIRSVFLDLEEEWTTVDGTVEALLIFASRRQHLLEVIDPTLDAGLHVLCDRFTDSTLVYQGCGRGVSWEVLQQVDALATGKRRPDWTLLFDLPAAIARDRGHSPSRRRKTGGIDRLDAEQIEFYERVREGYLDLARGAPERFRVIDSSGSIESTRRQVEGVLLEIFGDSA